jgi:hypothetical protein
MDWDCAPPNGFDKTTHTLCWDCDTSGDQDEEDLVPLLREHADFSLRHLHVQCVVLCLICCNLIQLFVNSNVLDSQRYPDHA